MAVLVGPEHYFFNDEVAAQFEADQDLVSGWLDYQHSGFYLGSTCAATDRPTTEPTWKLSPHDYGPSNNTSTMPHRLPVNPATGQTGPTTPEQPEAATAFRRPSVRQPQRMQPGVMELFGALGRRPPQLSIRTRLPHTP